MLVQHELSTLSHWCFGIADGFEQSQCGPEISSILVVGQPFHALFDHFETQSATAEMFDGKEIGVEFEENTVHCSGSDILETVSQFGYLLLQSDGRHALMSVR